MYRSPDAAIRPCELSTGGNSADAIELNAALFRRGKKKHPKRLAQGKGEIKV